MLTRKHYEAIAEVVARIEPIETRRQVSLELSNVFAIDNSRFDRQRFREACRLAYFWPLDSDVAPGDTT